MYYKSFNYKSYAPSNSSGKYYEDQLTKTPYQQLLQANYYQKDLGEPSRSLLPSSEYEIRKLIKEELNSMMIPYQQDINKTISVLETKLDSIEVLKGSNTNDHLSSSSSLSTQIEKQIETKVKDIQKEFNAKLEEQRSIISQLKKSQNEIEDKGNDGNDSVILKDFEVVKGDVKKMITEIKGIKEGNFLELKSLNTKSLKAIDLDQLSKCDFKTLNTIDLFQLKDISQGKGMNSLDNQLSSPLNNDEGLQKMNKKITELHDKVKESLEIGTMIQKLKLNDKFSDINNQLSQFKSQINDLQLSIDSIKSTASSSLSANKQSSGIGFDEINKINQQIIGLKQQVNGMQSKQSFFVEANALEAVSIEMKKKINSNDYHETVTQLKKDNEDLNQAMTEIKSQIDKAQSSSSSNNNTSALSLAQEKQELINMINTKLALIPNQDGFDEEVKKISQLENRIFILENAEKELACKDDIKFLLDAIDKINERVTDNENKMNTKQMNISGIADIVNSNNTKQFLKEVSEPVMITNLPKEQEKEIQRKKSPFAMAEKDEVLNDSNDQPDFVIEKADKGNDDNKEFKMSNDEPKISKPKKEHDPDDFDDFDVDEIEELN